jgi:hypothetical protein
MAKVLNDSFFNNKEPAKKKAEKLTIGDRLKAYNSLSTRCTGIFANRNALGWQNHH